MIKNLNVTNKFVIAALLASSIISLHSTTALSQTAGVELPESYVPSVAAPSDEIVSEKKNKPSQKKEVAKPNFEQYYAPSANSDAANSDEVKEKNPKGEDVAFRDTLVATYENNPRIIAGRRAFEASGEGFNEALAGWLPTLNANYQKGRRRIRNGDENWQYSTAETQEANASQPIIRIDTFYELDQANSTIQQSGAQLIGATQQVLLDAITRYLDVVRDREILMLNRNNVTVLKQQLEATKERFELGEATKTDLAQSEARLARAESDAIQAMGSLAITESAFTRIVGFKPATDFDYPQKVPVIPDNMEQVVEVALRQNPNLLAAKYGEEAADDAVGVNAARLLPSADLQGSMSHQKGSFFGDFDNDSVLLNVDIPLYQGGADYARIRRAKSVKSQRRYETIDATNQAREQAISAWENYQTTLAAIEAQRININAAEIALDGVKQEQLYGSRTVLDVLDAEQELFVARVNMERSERDLLVSLYSILNVIGQLSPAVLALGVEEYNQVEAISDIKYQLIGF
jgi:outer membrane protein